MVLMYSVFSPKLKRCKTIEKLPLGFNLTRSGCWLVFLFVCLGGRIFCLFFTKILYSALEFCLCFPYLSSCLHWNFNIHWDVSSLLYLSSQSQLSCNKSLNLIIAYMGWGSVPNTERALNGFSQQDMQCLLWYRAQPIPDHLWFSLSPSIVFTVFMLEKNK